MFGSARNRFVHFTRSTRAVSSTRDITTSATRIGSCSDPRVSSRFLQRKSPSNLPRHISIVSRPYTNEAKTPPNPSSSSEQSSDDTSRFRIPSHKWIDALEQTARAPWLGIVPRDDADKLRQAYALLMQMVLYLGRPHDGGEEAANQFLTAFESAPVSSTSEVGRARRSVATITRAVVKNFTSVPVSSALREKHKELFGISGALETLATTHFDGWEKDMFVSIPTVGTTEASGEGQGQGSQPDEEVVTRRSIQMVEQWNGFWKRAQPIVISLGTKLDEEKFGLEDDQPAAGSKI